jgi:hypothetical protein
MGFKLKKFKADPVETEFELNGDVMRLTVDADLLTGKYLARMEDLARTNHPTNNEGGQETLSTLVQANQNVGFMAETLAQVILKWDVEDEDGTPVPITSDFLHSIPFGSLNQLFEFVMGVNGPKKTTSATSGAGS